MEEKVQVLEEKRARQDRRWGELSEDSRKEILEDYRAVEIFLNTGKAANNDSHIKHYGRYRLYEDLFGRHNLSPEPLKPKTWEELMEVEEFEGIDTTFVELEEFLMDKDIDIKLRNKILATYQISQLINISYGGTITEDEWKSNSDISNICSIRLTQTGCIIIAKKINVSYCDREFISFHSVKLAEEFMSHKSNMRLIEEYFMR